MTCRVSLNLRSSLGHLFGPLFVDEICTSRLAHRFCRASIETEPESRACEPKVSQAELIEIARRAPSRADLIFPRKSACRGWPKSGNRSNMLTTRSALRVTFGDSKASWANPRCDPAYISAGFLLFAFERRNATLAAPKRAHGELWRVQSDFSL